MRTKIKRIKKYCKYCNKIFHVVPSLNRIKFCSKECNYNYGRDPKTIQKMKATMFKKGHIPWNKNKVWMPEEIKKRISNKLKGQ